MFTIKFENTCKIVANDFNSTTWKQRKEKLSEFETSLFYKANSTTAKATERNQVLKRS